MQDTVAIKRIEKILAQLTPRGAQRVLQFVIDAAAETAVQGYAAQLGNGIDKALADEAAVDQMVLRAEKSRLS